MDGWMDSDDLKVNFRIFGETMSGLKNLTKTQNTAREPRWFPSLLTVTCNVVAMCHFKRLTR